MASDPTDANPTSLPRSFRGYNRQATEELFRRVSWDYGVLAGEHRKLKQAMEALQPLPARRKGDLDGEAHLLFATAQKAVREMRESARVECEQALKKAKERSHEIEAEADRAATESAAVLKAAAAIRSTLQEALRRLESSEPSEPPANLLDQVTAAEVPPAAVDDSARP